MEKNMNGYDFDKTIYDGDSSTDFFLYMVLTRTYLLLFFPWFLMVVFLYGLKVLSKKKTKQFLFFFIPWFKNIDQIVEKFWDKKIGKVFQWYKDQQKENDLIISASLDFVLVPAMKRLGIKNYFCTLYNKKTGKIIGENCYGKQKYIRFQAKFNGVVLKSFYSDSMSDYPMMRIAEEAYLVKNKVPHAIDVPK